MNNFTCEDTGCDKSATYNIMLEIPGLWPDKNVCDFHLKTTLVAFDLHINNKGYAISEPHDHEKANCGMGNKNNYE